MTHIEKWIYAKRSRVLHSPLLYWIRPRIHPNGTNNSKSSWYFSHIQSSNLPRGFSFHLNCQKNIDIFDSSIAHQKLRKLQHLHQMTVHRHVLIYDHWLNFNQLLKVFRVFSQHRDMKTPVYSGHRLWQLQLICQCANMSNNHIRSNVPPAKLPTATKMTTPFVGETFKKTS